MQLRVGLGFFNWVGRSYLKYLVELCLELFRKHVMQDTKKDRFFYLNNLARRAKPHVVHQSLTRSSHACRELVVCNLKAQFPSSEVLDPSKVSFSNGDTLYASATKYGLINLTKRETSNRVPIVTLYRMWHDQDDIPQLQLFLTDTQETPSLKRLARPPSDPRSYVAFQADTRTLFEYRCSKSERR